MKPMEIQTKIDIGSISPSPYNPRVTLEKGSREYQDIEASLEAYGLIEPIVVNDVNMHIIGGHQRWQVLKDRGETEIACAMVHIEDPEREKALCLALNKISGDWDMDKLKDLLRDDDVFSFPTGFTADEISLDEMLEGSEEALAEAMGGEEDPGQDEEPEPPDDTQVEISTRIIISNNYKFKVDATRYYKLIERLRDKGMFEKNDIVAELIRRLMSND